MNSRQSITKVFVYGTLKPGEANYKNYCQGKTIAEIKGYTRGKLYHLPFGYPALTEGKNKVVGFLLSFSYSDILKDLDRLENYRETRSPQLNDYNRQRVMVYDLSDKYLAQAWCYLMKTNKIAQFQGKAIDGNDWHSHLNREQNIFGID